MTPEEGIQLLVERIAAALTQRNDEAASWTPTPANINALPDPIRRYIHDLETRCDPQGDIARLAIQADAIVALTQRVTPDPRAEPPGCPTPGACSSIARPLKHAPRDDVQRVIDAANRYLRWRRVDGSPMNANAMLAELDDATRNVGRPGRPQRRAVPTAPACPNFSPTKEQRAFLISVARTSQLPDGWTLKTGRACLLRDWVTFHRRSLNSWEWVLTPAGLEALHGNADALTDSGATK